MEEKIKQLIEKYLKLIDTCYEDMEGANGTVYASLYAKVNSYKGVINDLNKLIK